MGKAERASYIVPHSAGFELLMEPSLLQRARDQFCFDRDYM